MRSGVIVIDKPEGMTSHGVVALVRRLAGTKKVGHGGTLDPLATGVLPVFIGNATRVIEYMSEKDDTRAKKYRAKMRFGITTDTQDITGEVISETTEKFKAPNLPAFEAVMKSFEGEIEQMTPAYSAVKYKGRKLYDYARAGLEIPEEARKKRRVFVDKVEVTDYRPEVLTAEFEITCSGGLYVRTVCHDAGERLGCGAVMSSLRRLKSGPYMVEDSITPEALEAIVTKNGTAMIPLFPTDSAVIGLRKTVLSAKDAKKFTSGLRLSDIIIEEEGAVAVYAGDARSENFIGVGENVGRMLIPRKVLA
jgi:tRNA pseudouridine55 synthase